jgi:hypothetical protein
MAITGASFKPIAAVALLTAHLKVYQVRDQDAAKIGSNGAEISLCSVENLVFAA